jgi:hypothetical protein
MADIQINSDIQMNGGVLRSAGQATVGTDVPNWDQVQARIEGIGWKDSARVASTANINLASPGATIDGITMAAGDRVLVKDQTTQSQNGIYIWNGAAVAATRAPDASTFAELEGARIIVEEGTQAGTDWRQTQVNGTIDTNNVIFAAASGSAPTATETTAGIAEIATQAEADTGTDDARFLTPAKARNASWIVRRFVTTIGDGSATSYVVTHNLNNQRPQVAVSLTGSPFDMVWCEIEFTSVNTLTVKTNTAPAAGAYTVCVQG